MWLRQQGFEWLLVAVLFQQCAAQINLTYPSNTPAGAMYVEDNFFGISFEMQVINTIIGNTPTTIPTPIQAYLGNIRNRTNNPLRLRVGGNSMDSSYYIPTQTTMISGIVDNVNYAPIDFGPVLIDTVAQLGNSIGGAVWDVGLSLININSSLDTVQLALYAHNVLGNSLDSYQLGNEPDLYLPSGKRPGQANYTVQNLIDDYANVLGQMHSIANLSGAPMAGPEICCDWDLNTVLTNGFLGAFKNFLKYVTVQKYPLNNCPGLPPPPTTLDYFVNHYNVIGLGSVWLNGVQTAQQAGVNVSMTEFSSAACGGIAGVSNTFGATLWTIDYVLQLATLGYASAYIHTREAGITYNLFDPPAAGVDPNSAGWTTGPPYHALLVVAEALHKLTSPIMSVIDLLLISPNNTLAGYALYPAPNATSPRRPPTRFVLFNYAGSGTAEFYFTPNYTGINPSAGDRAVSVPAGNITVKYLLASELTSNFNISWAGQVVNGGGVLTGQPTNTTFTNCDGSGGSSCTITVPGPGLALVYLDGEQDALIATQNVSSATGLAGNATPSDPSGILFPAGSTKSLESRVAVAWTVVALTSIAYLILVS
ncbi:hypothetical protein FRB96_006816 [Tulasnella sp. 330]|nr:hypothetical protein FRB96_006816 [Tulasnella sp. 330]KAG8871963.1 hypothetical protein FRB98_000382 [Tulasnella sp. 332]